MIKLYQLENCPACKRVRRFLSDRNLSYEGVYVPRLGSARTEVLALEGINAPDVPVIVDDGKAIQGSDAILEHLAAKYGKTPPYGDPVYGLTRTLDGVPFADAVGKITATLKEQGFGVLTEIDVKATLKKKLDFELEVPYLILGACNPPFARDAVTLEPAIGLLLPCNVIVTEDGKGNAVVSTIDPSKVFQVVDRPELEQIAKQVRDRLRAALTAL